MHWTTEPRGTPLLRVGNDVGVDVGNDVGVKPPPAKGGQGGTGRAAELASEAARAEGASLTRHRAWPRCQATARAAAAALAFGASWRGPWRGWVVAEPE